MIVGATTMLAIRTGYAQIEAGEDEVKAWLRACQKVARHYSVKTTQKALDWIALAGVSATVWGTRGVSVWVEAGRRGRPPAARRGGDNVRPFPGANGASPPQAARPEPPPLDLAGVQLGADIDADV
jgi:hypothetical protein